MRLPTVSLPLIVLTLFGAAACSDGDDAGPLFPTTTDEPDDTDDTDGADRSSSDVELPAGDEPFLTITGSLFVTSGGSVYRPVAEPEGMAPGGPGPQTWEVAELTADGLATVVEVTDELGFFDPPPDYGDYVVTDSNTFQLIVTTADDEFVHELFDPEDTDVADADEARATLNELRDVLDDLPSELGDELGAFEPYVPDAWDVTQPYGDIGAGDVQGPSAPWPFSIEPAEGCTTFPGDDVTGDDEDTVTGRYVTDDDLVFHVEPRFPWEGDC